MSFMDDLDSLLGMKPKSEGATAQDSAVDSVPVDAAPVYDPTQDPEYGFEPEKIYDPDSDDPPKKEDPFAAIVDSILAAEGIDGKREARRKYNSTGNVVEHDWRLSKPAIFADDPYKFKCARCFRWVTVERDSTIDASLDEQGVMKNCSEQLVTDAMEM